ncbi:MAG TPA: hypothetical protein PLN81_09515, partial [Bacillota bacterium]|nr:hypothetical protein [Bacillota bacterium]HOP54309.1 hypothetical protein [Bacillota bacterium]HPQ11502.1 hypothetical protein [Bacillota bacterium]HPT61817.1 hypothetical protein [Bacillota bacterium]HPZ73476.1 hypothetical protein [Bacillota bacterium]
YFTRLSEDALSIQLSKTRVGHSFGCSKNGFIKVSIGDILITGNILHFPERFVLEQKADNRLNSRKQMVRVELFSLGSFCDT